MRRTSLLLVFSALLVHACYRGYSLPPADEIVEGRVAGPVATDTIQDNATVRIDRARWSVRLQTTPVRDFWTDIAVLDIPSAEQASHSLEERTFAVALKK